MHCLFTLSEGKLHVREIWASICQTAEHLPCISLLQYACALKAQAISSWHKKGI